MGTEPPTSRSISAPLKPPWCSVTRLGGGVASGVAEEVFEGANLGPSINRHCRPINSQIWGRNLLTWGRHPLPLPPGKHPFGRDGSFYAVKYEA